MSGHRQDAGGVGDHGGGLREGGSGRPGEPHHLHLRAQDPALSRDGQPGRRGEGQDVMNCSPVCFSWEVTAECDKCARCINIDRPCSFGWQLSGGNWLGLTWHQEIIWTKSVGQN